MSILVGQGRHREDRQTDQGNTYTVSGTRYKSSTYIYVVAYICFMALVVPLRVGQGLESGGGGLANVHGAKALEGGGGQKQRRHHAGVEPRGHPLGHR